MRKLAAALLIATMPVFAVLGAVFVLAAGYRAIAAEISSQNPKLSAVASSLTGPEQLARKQAANTTSGGSGNGRQIAFGIAFLSAAVLGLVSGILCLGGRAKKLVVAGATAVAAIALLGLIVEGFILLVAVGGLLALLALGAALFAKDWPRGSTPAPAATNTA